MERRRGKERQIREIEKERESGREGGRGIIMIMFRAKCRTGDKCHKREEWLFVYLQEVRKPLMILGQRN